jgi:hypothetical protein
MQSLKEKLKNRIQKKQSESKIQSWQEYAIGVCKDFSLTGNYRAMIFKYAKKNLCYLQGRVENVKEKFGTGKLNELGNYLISTFRSKKPWE